MVAYVIVVYVAVLDEDLGSSIDASMATVGMSVCVNEMSAMSADDDFESVGTGMIARGPASYEDCSVAANTGDLWVHSTCDGWSYWAMYDYSRA